MPSKKYAARLQSRKAVAWQTRSRDIEDAGEESSIPTKIITRSPAAAVQMRLAPRTTGASRTRRSASGLRGFRRSWLRPSPRGSPRPESRRSGRPSDHPPEHAVESAGVVAALPIERYHRGGIARQRNRGQPNVVVLLCGGTRRGAGPHRQTNRITCGAATPKSGDCRLRFNKSTQCAPSATRVEFASTRR